MTVHSSEIQKEVEHRFNIILTGDSSSGKSALRYAFTRGTFNDVLPITVACDYASQVIEFKANERDGGKSVKVNLQIWDTAGEERFKAITQSYYRKAIGVILVYDVTRRESFDNLRVWLEDFKRVSDPSNVVFLTIGAKADLSLGDRAFPPESGRTYYGSGYVPRREVLTEEGRRWAQNSENEMLWMETSSKDHTNVDEAFELLAKTIYCKVQSGQLTLPSLRWDTIDLSRSKFEAKSDPVARSGKQSKTKSSGKCC